MQFPDNYSAFNASYTFPELKVVLQTNCTRKETKREKERKKERFKYMLKFVQK